jgi:parallel beta-helix repeat protein
MVSRRRVLRLTSVFGVAGLAGCSSASQSGEDGTGTGTTDETGRPRTDRTPTTADGRDYDTHLVPEEYETIQAGVNAASAGDLVLVAPGTYTEAVVVSTPGVTIRGRDRNAVVLDGEFERGNAIEVIADGVALENLTGRFYRETPFYWYGVEGFRGSFLTAYNNGYYGIYATGSQNGRFEHSYASGHPDAGFYLGRNRPYDAVVTDVVAEHNAIGYSGTSTGGPLTVRDSVWRHNKVGIFPNTLDRVDPPQRTTTITGNQVYANNDPTAPSFTTYPLIGMGVLLWGGSDNVVADNQVRDHDNFGIVAHPHVVDPSGNEIRGNEVTGSGQADLALGRPAADGNGFTDNEFGTSLPADIETDASDGSASVTTVFEELARQMESGDFPAGDWREQPVPGDQPTMPDPEAAPRPAGRDTAWETPLAQTDGFGLQ